MSKTSALLFLGGEKSEYVEDDKLIASMVIAVDGGLVFCIEKGLKPDIIVGDMDSLSESMLSTYMEENMDVKVEVYPREKDYTDLELALKLLPSNLDSLVVYCGLGGRLDHTLANLDIISDFAAKNATKVTFRGMREDVYILTDENSDMTLYGKANDIVSLVPQSLDVYGVCIDKVQYPLAKKHLKKKETLGISNVMLASEINISIKSGILFVIHNKK